MGVPAAGWNCRSGTSSLDVVATLGALAECSSQLQHEPLKGTVSSTIGQLLSAVETHCQQCVALFLTGLARLGESEAAAYEQLWAIRHLVSKSEVTKRWISEELRREADSISALWQVAAAFPNHWQIQEEAATLVYTLSGIDGLVSLLRRTSDGGVRTSDGVVVQEAAIWLLHEVATKQEENCSEWPQANELVVLLAKAMGAPSASPTMLTACCQVLHGLIQGQPARSTLFMQRGGGEAVLAALRAGHPSGANSDAQELIGAASELVAAMVDGNTPVALRLQELGVLMALATPSSLALKGKQLRALMCAVGQVGGMTQLLRYMDQGEMRNGILYCGLHALAKLAWKPAEEEQQTQFDTLRQLLLLHRVATESFEKATELAVEAVGGVVNALGPSVLPGENQILDAAVIVLAKALGPSHNASVAKAASGSIGFLATNAPAWRKVLQEAAVGDLIRRMREPYPEKDEQKLRDFHFWAAAAVAGLRVVLEEMQLQPHCTSVQVAALNAIRDVLQGHVESAGDLQAGMDVQQVQHALPLVLKALQLHPTDYWVQTSGTYALSMLLTTLPSAMHVKEALNTVLTAMRTHKDNHKVLSGALSALRAFLEPRHLQDTVSEAFCAKKEEVLELCKHSLQVLAHSSNETAMEDLLYVLFLLVGVPVVLQALVTDFRDQVCLRRAGLKALFELGRALPRQVQPVAQQVAAALSTIVAETDVGQHVASGSSQDADALLQQAELVRGLLRQ